MRPIEGYDAINENGELKTLPAGIYGLVITNIVNKEENEYLEVYFDITKGEFKDYYKTWANNDNGRDHSKTIRSYKQTALSFFKGFITAVEKSNQGYQWNWDEKTLIGKNVIGVFGEEEYLDANNEVKTVVRIQEFRSLEQFKSGKLVVPPVKKLPETAKPVVSNAEPLLTALNDDDLPF